MGIDILGPLPTTPRGHKYILVIGDYFTKWFEAYPLENVLAVTVARYLVDGFVCRFGVPLSLHSDQGPQIESAVFREMCKLLDITKTRTTPYHPSSDGMVERYNRTLLKMLASVAIDHNEWDLHLQHVMFAYRTSRHESTGFTPSKLMFGRELFLPVDIMFGSPTSNVCPLSAPEYVLQLKSSLQAAFQLARQHNFLQQERRKRYYDGTVHEPPSTKVGNLVLLHSPAIPTGQCGKFYRPWTGPYAVKKVIDSVTVRIEHCATKRRLVVHVNRLKPYHVFTTGS